MVFKYSVSCSRLRHVHTNRKSSRIVKRLDSMVSITSVCRSSTNRICRDKLLTSVRTVTSCSLPSRAWFAPFPFAPPCISWLYTQSMDFGNEGRKEMMSGCA